MHSEFPPSSAHKINLNLVVVHFWQISSMGINENRKNPNVIDPWPGLTFNMYTTVICEDDDLGKCGYFELFTNNNREMLSKQSRVAVLSVDWHAINSS